MTQICALLYWFALNLTMLDISIYYTPVQLTLIIPVISIYSQAESVDPGQLASEKPDDLDLNCFQDRIYLNPATLRVKQCSGDSSLIYCMQIMV